MKRVGGKQIFAYLAIAAAGLFLSSSPLFSQQNNPPIPGQTMSDNKPKKVTNETRIEKIEEPDNRLSIFLAITPPEPVVALGGDSTTQAQD